jgi:hypothetical protein
MLRIVKVSIAWTLPMPPPPLVGLHYASRSTIDPGPAFEALAAQAAAANARLGVTGALYGDGRLFFQILEGEAGVLDALFSRILRDPRHCDVRLLVRRPIPRRQFARWAMKAVTPAALPPGAALFGERALLAAGPIDLPSRAAALRAA